ncbi:NUDIX hydrolase [Streptomyces sp. AC512_CC834]|uniref:NUDIX hydrolase n=1 Tax=Streptomyces sp. AC512_CC834 TaxID=2823691 RepID=UPI001C258C20|nr:NUDIX domain-containing protein [Streptomyces sp. AC512_CC834]
MPEQAPDWFRNPPPRRLGSLALLQRGDEIALIRRSYWSPISQWGLPGGAVAPDERPWTGLTRCLEEKLGNARLTPNAFLGVDHAPARPGHYAEGINFLYLVRVDPATELTPTAERGYVELRWVTPVDVSSLAVDHELLRIEQCLRAAHDGGAEELLEGVPQHSSRAIDSTG